MTVNLFRIKPAVESEKMILGSLLLDGPLYNIVKTMLCPKDFSDPERQEIYAAISDLFEKHGCFDMAMLVDEMPSMEELLYLLANECYSTANIEAHACIVREKSVQRQLIECASEMINLEKVPVNQKDLLVHYLQETAAKISSADITKKDLSMLLDEVSKAFISTLIDAEHRE